MAGNIVKVLIDRKKEITVKGEVFVWNSAFRCYNSQRDYRKLTWAELGVKEVSRTRAVSRPRRKKPHQPSLIQWKW